jgi:hypothetical protein
MRSAVHCLRPGLPDDILSYKITQFGFILEGLGMDNVCIFYGHQENFSFILYSVYMAFGIFCMHIFFLVLVHILHQEKFGYPVSDSVRISYELQVLVINYFVCL